MLLQRAKMIAENLVTDLLPYCERAEIAGSIRREKPEVKDIEIVAIPKTRDEFDMFGDITGKVSLLQEAMPSILNTWNGVAVKNGLKYKQIALLDENIKLDLFIVTQESWGVQFAIRTGSSDYSHWLVTQKKFGGALPSYAKIEGGRVLVNGKPIATPEEEDFFNFLGIVMPKPKDRTIQK